MSSRSRPRAIAPAVALLSLGAVTPIADALSFADAEREALARSPAIVARGNAIDAAQASRIAAGRLPDPRLVVGLENVPVSGPDRGSLTADFMTMRRVGVMQDFPNADKRQAGRDIADAAIARAEVEREVDKLSIRRAVGLAWTDRYYAEARLALLDALIEENRLLDVVVRSQIASGKANLLDALGVDQERARLEDQRDELEHEVHAAEARLARYVGERARDNLDGVPPTSLDTAGLADRLERSPDVLMFEPLRAMAAADIRAADAAQRPDWGVELSYAQRGAAYSNMISLQVSVDLPLFLSTRQAPRLVARRHDLARVDAEREDRLRQLRSEVEQALAERAELQSRISRMRQVVVPLAQRRVDVALDEYRANRIELPQVVAARRERLETQMKVLEIEQRLSQAVIRLATVLERESP
jgi:cobalt-zinc-cadmium efflux system outer membrane protein